jgi:hypothetical protein
MNTMSTQSKPIHTAGQFCAIKSRRQLRSVWNARSWWWHPIAEEHSRGTGPHADIALHDQPGSFCNRCRRSASPPPLLNTARCF